MKHSSLANGTVMDPWKGLPAFKSQRKVRSENYAAVVQRAWKTIEKNLKLISGSQNSEELPRG